jgi:hypothetical protein
MSLELSKSGIVLYPVGSEFAHLSLPSDGQQLGGEEGYQAAMNMAHQDVQPNLARQLGAATNASTDGETIQLGTAIAVPYSASVAYEINDLRHYKNGFLRIGSDATAILASERALLDELAGNAYRHLGELGLAKDGLFAALKGRRIDIIAPSGLKKPDGLAVAASRLVTQPGEFSKTDVVPASTWAPYGRNNSGFREVSGKSTEQHPATLGEGHPLYATGTTLPWKISHTHSVLTTAATGSEYIAESVMMPQEPVIQKTSQQQGTIRRKTTSEVAVTEEILYQIPHDMPAVTGEMTITEMEALMAPEPDLGDDALAMYDTFSPRQLTHQQQQITAAQLDPATSFEWASNIR